MLFGILLSALLAGSDEATWSIVVDDAGNGGYEAFPDVCRDGDGRLICVFYDSFAHVGLPSSDHPTGGRISMVVSTDEGRSWSVPTVLHDGPNDDRDPSIVALADGRLLCNFFVLTPSSSGAPFDGQGSWLVESVDGGKTWSAPRQITPDAYCSSPIRVLSDGRLILGLYHDGPNGTCGSVVTSDDAGKTWSDIIDIPNAGRKLDAETDLYQRKDGSILAMQRAPKGDMAWSVSTDRGETWGESKPVGFPGHCPYFLETPEGILVLGHRLPKTSLHWSADEGRTWSENVPVDDVIGAYPSFVNLKDGSTLVVYYEEGAGSSIRAKRFRATPDGIVWQE